MVLENLSTVATTGVTATLQQAVGCAGESATAADEDPLASAGGLIAVQHVKE